jgi:hypothetical protein
MLRASASKSGRGKPCLGLLPPSLDWEAGAGGAPAEVICKALLDAGSLAAAAGGGVFVLARVCVAVVLLGLGAAAGVAFALRGEGPDFCAAGAFGTDFFPNGFALPMLLLPVVFLPDAVLTEPVLRRRFGDFSLVWAGAGDFEDVSESIVPVRKGYDQYS